ncbi:MAG: hypothetical protein K9M54_02900 [Kiritimatiellales bacterium]|nr:hypothetical protein [Kiritimatiellales bacterium]MCF7864174.1 hypothetical protein [Kiritimatiellales bacterium]
MRIIFTAIVAIGFLAVQGCSDQAAKEVAADIALPKDLAMMQGTWTSVATNGCGGNCGATIEGYTIRVRYQETSDSPLVREGAIVDHLDEQKKLLIINNGYGAWRYALGTADGQERLDLEFFSQHHLDWRTLHMRRRSSEQM